ncbi:5' nucleotidase, NT5C type [Candidatus Poriferisocius sp.]|uniref:5' nucleotidase, NT5C type n=1 Tax=Candidatus Poriferisocius sp. TaxID=3101276 RepID=UPI003B01FCE2
MSIGPFVLGVDLDGVCAQHTVAFRKVVALEKNVPEESLTLSCGWGFEEWGFEEGDFEKYHRQAVVEHRMLANMPAMPGASRSLWRLSEAGVWIRIITHRLYTNWDHAIAAGDTAQWLDWAKIPYRDLCFVGGKTAVDAHVYIEDAPHNIEALREDGRKVIVFDQPYNRELDPPRAHDWEEVEHMLSTELAAHQGAVQHQLPGFDPGTYRLGGHTS